MATTTNCNNDGGPDWTSLPADVLAKIADDFLPYPDYLTFRSVCKPWAHSVPRIPMPSPWLLLPFFPFFTNRSNTHLSFYSHATQRLFHSPVPPYVSEAHCVGAHHGWLAMCGPTLDVFLFNPFTADRIDLPPFSTLPELQLLPAPNLHRFLEASDQPARKIRKLVFNSGPTVENFMAVAIDVFGRTLYTKAGKDKWSIFSDEEFGERARFFKRRAEDLLYHNGTFWMLYDSGILFGIDLRRRGLPKIWGAFNGFEGFEEWCEVTGDVRLLELKYLMASNGGKLFMVIRGGHSVVEDNLIRFETTSVTLMEFVGDGVEFEVIRRVDRLEGESFFIGTNNGFSLPTEECPQSRGNCVFITGTLQHLVTVPSDMGVVDIGAESFELMFPHSKLFNWLQPMPLWFEPTVKQSNVETAFGRLTMQGGKKSGGRRRKKTSGGGRRGR